MTTGTQAQKKKSTTGQNVSENVNKKASAVKSIYRAATILTCVSSGLNSITDIAEYCNLSKSTVHRLLKALGESNLIVQDPVSREYYLGQLITKLISRPQITHEYLIASTDKELKRLASITEETICLGVMTGLKYFGLREIPSKHQLRVVEAEPNIVAPIYAGAAGKVLLSQLSNSELKIAVNNIQLEPITDFTPKSVEELIKQIRRTRQLGYAISADEVITGATSIAAPIINYVLPVSLSLIGPTARIKPRLKAYIKLLLNSSGVISKNISESNELA